MINIKQYTNYDNLPIESGFYVIPFPFPVFKLGFCGDQQSIGKSITLMVNGENKAFEIGKTGMFEFQPETFRNINAESAEPEEIIVTCTEMRIPADLKFTLDYCYED